MNEPGPVKKIVEKVAEVAEAAEAAVAGPRSDCRERRAAAGADRRAHRAWDRFPAVSEPVL